MNGQDAALAVLRAAFADPEQIIYQHDGIELADPITVIRTDGAAPSFDGAGATLRRIVYEIAQSDLPAKPTKKNSFTHRGRRWKVEDSTQRDDIGAYEVIVVDDGEA